MLSTFAVIPAFDTFFTRGFRDITKNKCNFLNVNETSLNCIYDFYIKNKNLIDEYCKRKVIDFNGQETDINYTKAKAIDQYGYDMGEYLTN